MAISHAFAVTGPSRVGLADVCQVLEIANSRDAAARLHEDDKGVAITDTLRGGRHTGSG